MLINIEPHFRPTSVCWPIVVYKKFCAAKILLKPAPKGTGVKAGGSVRTVLEFAGVKNVVGKILGSSNKINNALATILALEDLKKINIPQKSPRTIKEPETQRPKNITEDNQKKQA